MSPNRQGDGGMPILVQKYGGTSVDGRDKIMRVARRVAAARAEGNEVVVVVSAQGGTTDALLSEARSITSEPAQRELDMLVTAGERISMSLLAIALNSLGCRAVSFTGSQVGIITDTRHTNARILEVRPARLVRELERGAVVVVGGFQGVSTEKEVTTLGRGGSDTTAVALAAALGAERCEILTDVDGVHTADPRFVPGAAIIEQISYEDMAELARTGATVLKEDAIRFAERERIALTVGPASRSTPGTIVLERPATQERSVVGLSLLRKASLLRLGPAAAHPAEALREHGNSLRFLAGSANDLVAAVERDVLPGSEQASLVCAVGPDAGSGTTVAAIMEAGASTGFHILAASSCARSATVAVPRAQAERALRALHSRFFD